MRVTITKMRLVVVRRKEKKTKGRKQRDFVPVNVDVGLCTNEGQLQLNTGGAPVYFPHL